MDAPAEVPLQSDLPNRSLDELRTSGLLWLINRTVFHPRGYALSINYADGVDAPATGWSLMGDGTEAWGYNLPEGVEDELMAKVKALLA